MNVLCALKLTELWNTSLLFDLNYKYTNGSLALRFTALSCFETKIYQRVFLRGRTHTNKAVTDRQTKFVNKHFITVLSVRLI